MNQIGQGNPAGPKRLTLIFGGIFGVSLLLFIVFLLTGSMSRDNAYIPVFVAGMGALCAAAGIMWVLQPSRIANSLKIAASSVIFLTTALGLFLAASALWTSSS